MPNHSTFKKILVGLGTVGPGLFLIGYNIGTGSVTTMAKVGAEHGMSLSWALALSCLFTYVLMVAYGKTTLVTGATALHNIKNHLKFGKSLAIYIIVALILGELLALMGIMGIVSDLLSEGARLLWGEPIDPLLIVFVVVIGLYALLWFGRYQVFEKVLMVFVILMGFSFIVVFFMVKPNISSVALGLIPSIPNEPGAFALVAAIAGTTCSAAVFIMRSTVVAEKGWTRCDLKKEERDAAVSATVMFLLSIVIMAVSAGTLHVMGKNLTNTIDLISLFEPIGGKIAAFLLILGIAGAGLSTIFPIILIAPWLISDYTGKPRDIQSPMYRILGLIGILFGFGTQFMETPPPLVMISSQAFQALILPAVAVPVFLLINRKELMQAEQASLKMNLGLGAVILFSLVTSYLAVVGLIW